MHRDEGRLRSLGGRERAGRLVELTLTEALDTARQEQEQRGGGLGFRAQRALRSIRPLALKDVRRQQATSSRHGRRRRRDRFGLPTVALGDCDRLGGDRPLPGQRPSRQEGHVGETADLEEYGRPARRASPGRARGRVRHRPGDAPTARGCLGSSRPSPARRLRGTSSKTGCRLEERARTSARTDSSSPRRRASASGATARLSPKRARRSGGTSSRCCSASAMYTTPPSRANGPKAPMVGHERRELGLWRRTSAGRAARRRLTAALWPSKAGVRPCSARRRPA